MTLRSRMPEEIDPWLLAACGLLLAVMGLNVYRAATQSITIDEALTWDWYVRDSWHHLFTSYDANHHVLHSILCKLSVACFGVKEWALRLPSLAGGLLYLIAALRLARRIGGTGPAMLLGFAALALNPYVLDFLSIARGYGLGLGLLLAAADELVLALEEPDAPRHLRNAGIAFGLAATANLTMLIPACAFGAGYLLAGGWRGGFSWSLRLAAPVAMILALLYAGPLHYAAGEHFYVGSGKLADSITGLILESFYRPRWSGTIGDAMIDILRDWILPTMIVLIAGYAIWSLGRRNAAPVLFAGGLLGSLVAIEAAHRIVGMPYPFGRTGLYLIPLFTLALLAAGRWGLGPLILMAAVYLFEIPTGDYSEWEYLSGTKTLVRTLGVRHAATPERTIRLGGSWQAAPGVNFYRAKRNWVWLAPMERTDPQPGCDFYLLIAEDAAVLERLHLRVIEKDARSGMVLAVPSS